MYVPYPLRVVYQTLSSNCENFSSNRTFQAMLHATESTMNEINKRSICKLLRSLRNENIGTSDVEYGIRKMCAVVGDAAQVDIKRKIMRWKVNDAFRVLRETQHANLKIWRESKRCIPLQIRTEYLRNWRLYTDRYKMQLEARNRERVKWLVAKWRKKEKPVPDTIRGIKLNDETLPLEFNSQPRIYGNMQMSNNEMKLLELPPKFGLYRKVNVRETIISTEEAINKIRWNRSITDNEPCVGTQFIDINTRLVDINYLQPTMLPFNPQVSMPPALTRDEEIRLQQFKNDVGEIVGEVEKESKKWSNLGLDEKNGLNDLRRRVDDGEMVCCVTDKSGRWSCDSTENYKMGCINQLNDSDRTPEITVAEHEEGEREMNGHALALGRMMGLKEGNRGNRLRYAMTAQGSKLATLYGLRKDHKVIEVGKEVEGPKMRPVCGAKECHTKRVSYILCLILSHLIPDNGTQCNSTDDLLGEIERLNQGGQINQEWVVGSLDVESLYPSLDVKRCARVIRDKLYESNLGFADLQWKEIALYIRYHMTNVEIANNGLEEFCPKRKYRRRPPIFVTSGSDPDTAKRHEPWVFPNQDPDQYVLRRMFCVAIEVMVIRTMSLHDFKFDNKIYRQGSGGAIGLDLTGVVSDIYMCYWDSELLRLMEENAFLPILYKRYKDDVNFIIEMDPDRVNNNDRDGTNRSAVAEIKTLGESIDKNIKVTTDLPCNHDDRRLPLLDIKVWIGESRTGEIKVMHTHYIKEVSTRSVINAQSSHGDRVKYNVMVNEVCRILKNCSVHLEWKEAAAQVSYFIRRLQYSGYDNRFRYNVVERALRRHDERLAKYRGSGSMFPKLSAEEKSQKMEKRSKWYSDGGKYESVMFVEPTPGAKLRKRIQQAAIRNRVRVKVVEKVGTTVKQVLQKSNPFKSVRCERGDCTVCESGSGQECRTTGCVYEVMCKDDERKYRGTTGRSIYERVKEEMSDWRRQEDRSPLWKHSLLYHDGQDFDIDIKVLSQCYGKPSKRMITEAVVIDELPMGEAMNSKTEWSYMKLSKVQVK